MQGLRGVGPKRAYSRMSSYARKNARKARYNSGVRTLRNKIPRPISSIGGYRNVSVYRFCRETLPQIVPFSLIPQGTGSYPAIGYMSFENLQFNQLPGVIDDFEKLFARYKVDMIVTELIPMFQDVNLGANWTTPPAGSPQLEITKVNTKYMNGDFPIAATSQEQLSALAQLQAKSKRLYTAKRSIKLITKYPGINARSVVDSSGNEVDARKSSPWLSLSGPNQAIDVPFKHNAVIFGAPIDGAALTDAWKYRVTHKLYFRCSQVG